MTEPGSQPAVAVAVVTSRRLGVLAGRRRDAIPPWTFPGGKIRPGESPEDAAVRETLEETGLRVRAARIIGSRVHPLTGVLIIYVAAAPVNEADPVTPSAGELDEVRWVTAARAGKLMPDMSGAVRDYLRRALGR